jgi:SAM-dependent methyltransferase
MSERGEIDVARLASLLREVRIVAEPWAGSAYYENAEQWTYFFWQEGGVFRRLFNRLDTTSLVELAVGHGRHAERAAQLASKLCVIDVLAENIGASAKRLAAFNNVSYLHNDGFSYRPVADASVTGIYCYDAMVHFSPEIVAAYLQDTQRVLAPGGRAVFHHSNYAAPAERHYGQNPHARNHMTQALFSEFAARAGLTVSESVVIPWGKEVALDCVTLLEKPA